jgi:hypothetical protein
MAVLITFVLLFLSISAMVVLRLTRPGISYTWLAAATGALLTWISILFWQGSLPWQFAPGQGSPQALFSTSPQLLASPYSWLYALSLSGLAAAVIWTSPARTPQARMASWLGTLALTALGLLAILMDNPLGLVLTWMAIDLTEFVLTMRTKLLPALSERAVFVFSVRLAGTGIAIWASVVGASNGQSFLLESTPQQAGIYLLLAASLRLGVLPLHLVYQNEPALRRGFGTLLHMVVATTSLLVLARVPVSAVDSRWILLLFVLTALAALYGSWQWLFAPDGLNGRPYWMIGMGALALAAALGGNPAGSTAWGVALILFGGISFLYSAKQIWFTRVFAGMGLLMLALPFTLTASGWQADFPLPFVFWPLFLSAHAMLVAGYVRHLARAGDTELVELPSWAQAAYPFGMAILAVTILLGGLWGWPGAFDLGAWPLGLVSFALSGALTIALFRLPQRGLLMARVETFERQETRPTRLAAVLQVFPRLARSLYQGMSQLIIYISALLEGDGGLLWTLLLLVLLASFLRGR